MHQLREIKVLFLGSANLGKSHLRHRLSRLEIPTHYRPTLGTEVSPVRLVGNGDILRANIWDCAGDNRYAGLEGGYYGEAGAVVIFKEDGNDNHKKYEMLLEQMGLDHIPKLYINNYKNQNEELIYYKNMLFNLVQNI
jgi:Ras-related protein Rab-11A